MRLVFNWIVKIPHVAVYGLSRHILAEAQLNKSLERDLKVTCVCLRLSTYVVILANAFECLSDNGEDLYCS